MSCGAPKLAGRRSESNGSILYTRSVRDLAASQAQDMSRESSGLHGIVPDCDCIFPKAASGRAAVANRRDNAAHGKRNPRP